jgi:protoheme IX farnesyltransferase
LDNNNKYAIVTSAESNLEPLLSYSKAKDLLMLSKLKLSLVVVISSLLGYVISANGQAKLSDLSILFLGGMLVTAAANALNQVLEKDFDIQMARTQSRPIATGRMKSSEGVMFAGISCIIGVSLLALFNPLTALLGMVSMVLYAFVYTPLKRYTTLSVAMGALPGALPVLIGSTAFDGRITILAFTLFLIQFLWQFPHFWAIGFLGFEDYKKAGFKLLPTSGEDIQRSLGLSAAFYALLILPIIVFMQSQGLSSIYSTIIAIILTLTYFYFSLIFHKKFDQNSAKKLMFFSFFYLPFILINYWIF